MSDTLLIDQVLLSCCTPQWQKVAEVLARAACDPRLAAIAAETRTELLTARVSALFDDGRLDAEGDLDEWRFNEIRLAGPDA